MATEDLSSGFLHRSIAVDLSINKNGIRPVSLSQTWLISSRNGYGGHWLWHDLRIPAPGGDIVGGTKNELLQSEAPKIAKLVYNSNNYGLWYL